MKERFRPFVAELLASFWEGDRVICLGTEAFQWFAPYADERGDGGVLVAGGSLRGRAHLATIVADHGGSPASKAITLMPLPHPSPLNQRWYGQIPGAAGRPARGWKSAIEAR